MSFFVAALVGALATGVLFVDSVQSVLIAVEREVAWSRRLPFYHGMA